MLRVQPCEFLLRRLKLPLFSGYGLLFTFERFQFPVEAFFLLKEPPFGSLELSPAGPLFLLDLVAKPVSLLLGFQQDLPFGSLGLFLSLFNDPLRGKLRRLDLGLCQGLPGEVPEGSSNQDRNDDCYYDCNNIGFTSLS